MSLIRIDQVSQHFRTGAASVTALDNLSLTIAEGRFLGVMGPSGSGKSTLLNVLGCLSQPSSGTVRIDEIDIYALAADRQADFRREYLGFIFQSHNLMPYLSALENVMLPLVVSRLSSAQKQQRAEEILERVGLSQRLRHLPHQLSGGEQERVAIARALVNHPPLLLADEPTGSLDSATSLQVMELLSTLHREGQTIVMVTHNPDNQRWFDQIINLRDGRVEDDGNRQDAPDNLSA
jgi:putative ABC transport system ATP-binding protein